MYSKFVLLTVLSFTPCLAAPVAWNFAGGVFNDGGTVSGSFVYDADLNQYSDINIWTTGGTMRSGSVYSHLNSNMRVLSSASLAYFVSNDKPDQTGLPTLIAFFSTPLSNGGGAITLPALLEQTCANSWCGQASGEGSRSSLQFNSNVQSAAVVSSIPEPASLVMGGLGLLTIAGLKGRRR